jgi:NAD(P)-dependent dehydrogenase (short-subunit alcohol dehydrogenase family)
MRGTTMKITHQCFYSIFQSASCSVLKIKGWFQSQTKLRFMCCYVLLQVVKVAERVTKEVGNATVVINCCNLPSPRVLIESPAADVRKTLDVGVMSHFWVSLSLTGVLISL